MLAILIIVQYTIIYIYCRPKCEGGLVIRKSRDGNVALFRKFN